MKTSTLFRKQIISTKTGEVIGKIKDMEMNPIDFHIEAVCIERHHSSFYHWLCSVFKETRIVLPVDKIVSIGADVILVEVPCVQKKRDN